MSTVVSASFLESMLRELHDGNVSGDDFFRVTNSIWLRMAQYLLRRWPAPAWVDADEVAQELCIGVWRNVWRYQPARSASLHKFVVWNAMDYAKKRLHRMRGAKLCGSADRNPSRFEIPMSAFDVTPEWLEGMLTTDGEQHHAIEEEEAFVRALSACVSESQRAAIKALYETRDIAAAADFIDSSPEARFAYSLTTESSATELVTSTAEAVAERLTRSIDKEPRRIS